MAQNLRQKLNNADSKFFDEDPEDGAANSTIRKDLLTFRSAELKTVFTEVDDEIDSGPGKNIHSHTRNNVNTQYMRNPTMVYPVNMEYG